MENQKIKCTCYGKAKEFNTREDAIKFFLEGIACSEGSERDRYTNILLQLYQGCTECSDEE